MENGDRYHQVPEAKYECLLFDVDDTLYPFSSGLSHECTKNIIGYMVEKIGIEENEAPEINVRLYKDYGTTMAGLRASGYNFDYDDYHSFVHGRLPYEILKPDPVLKGLLQSLPIRKFIFSNANKEHVTKVLGRLGLEDCFEGVICFDTLNPVNKRDESDAKDDPVFRGPKPSAISCPETHVTDNSCHPNAVRPNTPIVCKPFEDAFEKALKLADINPQKTLFFDDSIRNLQTGKLTGLHTVWVGSSHRAKGVDYALESIHNIREALPELWETAAEKTEEVVYSETVAIETSVRA
ncbi:uncharacterized protein C24B11.05-like [Diospyros lotus]|uniref:uncharacterized protein C24B11.05-like n=1 Tax=Diospyros lotus TaxID=55363 RepID=UPI0022556485|nr:uncharacterized protein C24B11.05-like [Diospyros lotus]XP_052175245.1 uncharacterized protein C24B11.05-like [Diospyros lotus]